MLSHIADIPYVAELLKSGDVEPVSGVVTLLACQRMAVVHVTRTRKTMDGKPDGWKECPRR